jgi:hypothetical protein
MHIREREAHRVPSLVFYLAYDDVFLAYASRLVFRVSSQHDRISETCIGKAGIMWLRMSESVTFFGAVDVAYPHCGITIDKRNFNGCTTKS